MNQQTIWVLRQVHQSSKRPCKICNVKAKNENNLYISLAPAKPLYYLCNSSFLSCTCFTKANEYSKMVKINVISIVEKERLAVYIQMKKTLNEFYFPEELVLDEIFDRQFVRASTIQNNHIY